jgi:phosphoglycerate dehydrogenase-like enzyme
MRRVVFNMQDERPVWSPPPWVATRLREALPAGFELVEVAAPVSGRGDGGGVSAEAYEAVRGAEIYFGLGLPRELLLAALAEPRRLRWIHTGAAGVASLLHPELRDSGILLTNSAGIHGPPIAETVLGMMLHFARGLDRAVRAQQRAEWDATSFERSDSGIREIAGATLGIVGYGGLGRALARRARALGMRVLVVRRRLPSPAAASAPDAPAPRWIDGGPGGDSQVGMDETGPADEIMSGTGALHRLLEESDFVVLAVPATPATRGMIGAAELARMRAHAVLINVARGAVIDEAALLAALRERRLGGAALDVFTSEPLPPASGFWALDNVLITPHVSATTPRFWDRQTQLMLDNLGRYHAGEPLRNTVDPDAGY